MGNRRKPQESERAARGDDRDVVRGHDRGEQQGAQTHAEGEHGDKTHARLVEELNEGRHEEPVSERRDHEHEAGADQGKRRPVEDRQQHDEAEKNSEHERTAREAPER